MLTLCVVCASIMSSPVAPQLRNFDVLPNIMCETSMLRAVDGIACEMKGMFKKIIKQFGLLPFNTAWEMFDSPSMLIPSNPAPLELFMATSEMVTLIVCTK